MLERYRRIFPAQRVHSKVIVETTSICSILDAIRPLKGEVCIVALESTVNSSGQNAQHTSIVALAEGGQQGLNEGDPAKVVKRQLLVEALRRWGKALNGCHALRQHEHIQAVALGHDSLAALSHTRNRKAIALHKFMPTAPSILHLLQHLGAARSVTSHDGHRHVGSSQANGNALPDAGRATDDDRALARESNCIFRIAGDSCG